MFKDTVSIELKINGVTRDFKLPAGITLLEVLRDELHYTGAKQGCSSGDCGACTVILNGQAVRSCSVLAVEAEGGELQTVEGLANGNDLHPLQQAFIDERAFQCGYCTPGMLMSAKALLDEVKDPDEEQIASAISGNLCRCSGYLSIVRAIKTAGARINGKSDQSCRGL